MLKGFDIYRHVPRDMSEPTVSGGVVSIVSVAVMILLFFTEFISFLRVETVSSMFVDAPSPLDRHNQEPMRIHIDISLPAYPCAALSVDVQDVMGTHIMDVGGELHKFRLNAHDGSVKQAAPIPAAEKVSHEDAKMQKGEGCQVRGHLLVKRVPGNFHLSAHSHPELLQTLFDAGQRMNVSHTIHHLSFGPDISAIWSAFAQSLKTETDSVGQRRSAENADSNVPTINALTPLNGLKQISLSQEKGTVSHEYYIKIVPTILENLDGERHFSYQFTAHANQVAGHFQLPAVFFRWDMSPITVKFQQRHQSFTHFLVQICAIIGGVFTVLGLLNSFIHSSVMRVKRSLGKLG